MRGKEGILSENPSRKFTKKKKKKKKKKIFFFGLEKERLLYFFSQQRRLGENIQNKSRNKDKQYSKKILFWKKKPSTEHKSKTKENESNHSRCSLVGQREKQKDKQKMQKHRSTKIKTT